MHKLTNYNSLLIQSQTNACRSPRGSVSLMGEKNTTHLLKKFQMTMCQYTICTAADCINLQNRRLMWNWATAFLPGPQIDWLMFSLSLTFPSETSRCLLIIIRTNYALVRKQTFVWRLCGGNFIGFKVCLSSNDHTLSNVKRS